MKFPNLRAVSLLGALALLSHAALAQDAVPNLPPPALDEKIAPNEHREVIVLAGGCFWGVQGVFEHVKGVTSAVAGYTGGEAGTARYETVALGNSGHAESVQITFDPHRVTLGTLLRIYFSVVHDPTTLDYQDYDTGPQYRSAIFPRSAEQVRVAKAYIAQLDRAHVFSAPIVTEIDPGHAFYQAEDYHQNFVARDPTYPYVAVNDLPKLDALKHMFPALYREKPVLVPITHPVKTP